MVLARTIPHSLHRHCLIAHGEAQARVSYLNEGVPLIFPLTRALAAADSILPFVVISTHPTLKVNDPFCFHIPASNNETQTSKIITLSVHNSLVQIEPSLPSSLHSRPYRLFVTVNGQRMTEVKRLVANTQEYIQPSFEAKLVQGVNRVEVEVVAVVAAKLIPKNVAEQLEVENLTIFAHVLRD